jgi:lipoyl(octanoyl) transferase
MSGLPVPANPAVRGQSPASDLAPVDWAVGPRAVDYDVALAAMEARVGQIADGSACEAIWLLEHPSLYTAGTSARPEDLLRPEALPVYQTGRGGQFTYHGPGQRIAYVMLDVRRRFGGDVRRFTRALETWLIEALAPLGVTAFTIQGRTGVWVETLPDSSGDPHAKIAAIGLRIRHGISFHGVALNVDPDLAHFSGIVPCGLKASRVTSLADLGHPASLSQVDAALQTAFSGVLGIESGPPGNPLA